MFYDGSHIPLGTIGSAPHSNRGAGRLPSPANSGDAPKRHRPTPSVSWDGDNASTGSSSGVVCTRKVARRSESFPLGVCPFGGTESAFGQYHDVWRMWNDSQQKCGLVEDGTTEGGESVKDKQNSNSDSEVTDTDSDLVWIELCR